MISNLFEKDIIKILSFFLISPGSRHTRKELKEKTEMNNLPLDNALNKLLVLKILKKEKNLISLNLESEEQKKIIELIKEEYNKFALPHKIFNILVEVSNKLCKIKEIKEVILFGSYSKLIYNVDSDIDLAIITEEKSMNFDKKIENILSKIEKRERKRIELHFFSQKDLKHKEDPLIKDIIRNGKKML